jgi:hypothetical protein
MNTPRAASCDSIHLPTCTPLTMALDPFVRRQSIAYRAHPQSSPFSCSRCPRVRLQHHISKWVCAPIRPHPGMNMNHCMILLGILLERVCPYW